MTQITIDTELVLDPDLKKALFASHRGRCFYTGRRLPLESLEIEHIEPCTANGKDCLANLVLACKEVNKLKRDKRDDHFVERMTAINRLVFAPRALDFLSGKLKATLKPTEKHMVCVECGEIFITIRRTKRFCSDSCRVKNWQKRFPRMDPTTGKPRENRALA